MNGTVNTYVGTDGKYNYNSSSPIGNSGNSFRFPYEYQLKALREPLIKDICDPSKNIYVTRLTNDNKYYFKGTYSGAVKINNNNLITNQNDKKFDTVKKLKDGTTLANCVGWAHGRINEIWGTAVDSKYVVGDGGNWVIPSRNNQIVICGREPSAWVTPRCDAYSFYANWPQSAGWTKTSEYQDDIRPCPGAIICWRNITKDNGLCGHVAVVEAVYNYGLDSEYIVVSQSGYSTTGAQKVVWLQEIYRNKYANGAPYMFSKNYKFAGFLFSPVCQLLPAGADYGITSASYNAGETELVKADLSTYERLSAALAGKEITTELTKGAEVEINWFGSTTPDDTDDKVNLLGLKGKIVSIDNSKTYPYAVSVTDDNTISGYFAREAIKRCQGKT